MSKDSGHHSNLFVSNLSGTGFSGSDLSGSGLSGSGLSELNLLSLEKSESLQKFFDRGLKLRQLKFKAVIFVLILAALIVLAPLFGILGFLSVQGLSSIQWSFFTEIPRPVGESGGGVLNAIVGSVFLVTMASSMGIVWGVLVGIYLSEYGKGWLGHWVRFSTEILASIPSILIGLFTYVLIVLPMKRFSALAGAFALGVIMIPTIARTTEEILKLVPSALREAGLALGIARWRVTLQIVVRGSLSGIGTGVVLAVARASGETAPLLFTSFGNQFLSYQLDQPISSLPQQIFTFAISPYDDWHQKAWGAALVLMFFVLSTNLLTRFVLSQVKGRSSN